MTSADIETMRLAIEKLNHKKLLRILAPLVHKGAYLSQVGDNAAAAFSYGYRGRPVLSADTAVPASEVATLVAEDLIEACANGYRISAAGRARLKRELSPAEPFQSQHGARRPELRTRDDGGEQLVIVNDAESPLAWLARRKDKSGEALITPCQFAAGERLRADYTYAALNPRLTSRYDASPSGRGGGNDAAHLSDTMLAARQRVTRALAAVGPELGGVLVDVCCHLMGLEDAERREGWPKRSGKVVLQIALTALARHYGLIGTAEASGASRRRLQHWGASDYRPTADGGEPQEAAAS
jgi:Domain of unknown function (DUF6456)